MSELTTILTEERVADMLGLSVKTLQNWRALGEGPRYYRPKGRRGLVYYLLEDILDWVRGRETPVVAPVPAQAKRGRPRKHRELAA
jgi:predicted site-specific integrase-resolvase